MNCEIVFLNFFKLLIARRGALVLSQWISLRICLLFIYYSSTVTRTLYSCTAAIVLQFCHRRSSRRANDDVTFHGQRNLGLDTKKALDLRKILDFLTRDDATNEKTNKKQACFLATPPLTPRFCLNNIKRKEQRTTTRSDAIDTLTNYIDDLLRSFQSAFFVNFIHRYIHKKSKTFMKLRSVLQCFF